MIKDLVTSIIIAVLLAATGYLAYDKYFTKTVSDIAKQIEEKQKELDKKIEEKKKDLEKKPETLEPEKVVDYWNKRLGDK